RIFLPILRRLGQFAARFTPQASLQDIQHKLDLAGNPKGIDPTMFFAARIGVALGLGFVILFLTLITKSESLAFAVNPLRGLAFSVGAAGLGFFMPTMLLQSRIKRRQDSIIKSMP